MAELFTKTILFLLFLVPISLSAQSSHVSHASDEGRLSIGAEIAAPISDFAKSQGAGLGLTVRNEAPLGDVTAMMFTAGYIHFFGKPIKGTNATGESTYMIPIQLGFKYYIPEQQNGFYIMLQAGAHGYKGADVDSAGVHTKIKFAFSYAPELGVQLENFDLGARLQLISTPGITTKYLGLRLAFVFW